MASALNFRTKLLGAFALTAVVTVAVGKSGLGFAVVAIEVVARNATALIFKR